MSFDAPTLLLAVGILLLLALTLGVFSARLFISATRGARDEARR